MVIGRSYKRSAMDDGALLVKERAPEADFLHEAAEIFIQRMNDIELRIVDPGEDPMELMSLITRAILEMSFVCERFESAHISDRDAVKKARADFRKKTDELFRKSYFMNRARIWPQGYPGDYLTLEGFYQNMARSDGIGYYLDKHFLSTILAEAVRERKKKFAEMLAAELYRRKVPDILNIASGSCRELLELATALKAADAKVTCLDFDGDALDFAAIRMSHSGLIEGRVQFRRYNALKMINHDRNIREFGMQDVIYSIGLFDYLNDETIIQLMNALYRLLKPGGTMIVSFKDSSRYRPQEYHWFVVWDGFRQRVVDEMWRLCDKAEIPRDAVTTSRDRTGVIVFFKIDR